LCAVIWANEKTPCCCQKPKQSFETFTQTLEMFRQNFKEIGMAKGVKHYFKTGKEHKGATHKMPNGQLHSNKTHTKTSKPLVHFNQLSKTAKKVARGN
tara:strand:- start:295 stop:588 length:294 start_codon:yes stop_codon:yes gene_type:complete